MCTANAGEGDRRTIQSTGPLSLLPGAKNELIIGVPWVPNQNYPCPALDEFLKADQLCQDLFDNRHPNYVGDVAVGMNPAIEQRIRNSDLLIAIGPRLGEWTTINYTLIDIPRPKQKFVHIHSGVEELGRVYQADLAINVSPRAFCASLAFIPLHLISTEYAPAEDDGQFTVNITKRN